ncbi:Calx-beta domain-containing protein [Amphritea sp.]|uniref:Calx-beta domain-containing protein n=1 Tax=Amphritea sp. TaxID=1872502 RepID=UPI0025C048AA|nr:Calx-beta domain-containing protein [Amphritea sp.]
MVDQNSLTQQSEISEVIVKVVQSIDSLDASNIQLLDMSEAFDTLLQEGWTADQIQELIIILKTIAAGIPAESLSIATLLDAIFNQMNEVGSDFNTALQSFPAPILREASDYSDEPSQSGTDKSGLPGINSPNAGESVDYVNEPPTPPNPLNHPELTGLTRDSSDSSSPSLPRPEVTGLTLDNVGGQSSGTPETTLLTQELTALTSPTQNVVLPPTPLNLESRFSIGAMVASVVEGSDGEITTVSFVVSRTNPIAAGDLSWSVSGLSSDDFVGAVVPGGTLSFVVGESEKTITIDIAGDRSNESIEQLQISIDSNDVNFVILKPQANTTILNDDSNVQVSVDLDSVNEGNEGTSQILTYTLTRGNALTSSSVDWSVAGMDAAGFVGGQALNGTVNFAVGETSKTITLEVLGDKTIETTENLVVSLSNPGDNLNLGTVSSAATTVVNDDGEVVISVDQSSIDEGRDGTSQVLTYTLSRDNTLTSSSVDWSVEGMDAADFAGGQALNGTVTFAVGDTSKTFTLEVLGDKTIEATENLVVSLSNPGDNLNLGAASSAITAVVNDDGEVVISVDQSSIDEGRDGTSQILTYTLSRDNTLTSSSVDWSVAGMDAADFAGGQALNGTVTFAVGDTSKTITLEVLGDKTIEATENLVVSLSNPGDNLNLGTASSAATTVVNDDGEVVISVDQSSIDEGREGTSQVLTYTLSRDNTLTSSSVDWSVAGMDAADFAGGQALNGTVTFSVGDTSKTITLEVLGDKTIEATENLVVSLSNSGDNLNLGAVSSAATTVVNDDGEVVVSVDHSAIDEGSEGTSQVLTYTLSRDNTLTASSVDWSVTGLVDIGDFAVGQALSGTVNFAAGESSKTVTLEVIGDKTIEIDESIVFTLSNPGDDLNLGGVSSNTTRVIDDDSLASIVADQVSVVEGNEGSSQVVTFTVSRSGSLSASQVDWSASGLDATDFDGGVIPSGMLNFAVGELSQQISIIIDGDRDIESDETLTVSLSNPGSDMTLGTASADITVINDDSGFSLIGDVMTLVEGGTGSEALVQFHVVRSEGLNQAMDIDFRLIGLGASSADALDFTAGQDGLGDNGGMPSGTVSFGAGETSKAVTVRISGDATFEPNEAFGVLLENPPAGASIVYGEAFGEILTDEMSFDVSAVIGSVLEGNRSDTGGQLEFLVTRQGDIESAANVGYQINGYGESPVNTADFAAAQDLSGSVVFAAGQASVSVFVDLEGDSLIEGIEHFSFDLVPETQNTIIGIGTALGTIAPDDIAIVIASLDAIRKEGSTVGEEQQHSFIVTRGGYLDAAVVLDWEVVGNGGSPVDASDFGGTLPSGTLIINSGDTQGLVSFAPSVDELLESNQGYQVILTTAQDGVVLSTDRANGTILNDDMGLTLLATNLDRPEGNPGDTSQLSFSVSRSGDLTQSASVNWALLADSVNGVDSSDFDGGVLPSGTIDFLRGVQTQLVTIPLSLDEIIEADEGFSIQLSGASGGTEILLNNVSGVIRNDDASFALQPGSTVQEGDSGTTVISLTVLRSGDLSGTDTVNFSVSDALSGASVSADDFVGGVYPTGTVTFNPTDASQTIEVAVQGDGILETDEGLTVTLATPSAGSTITADQASVVVSNDDDSLSITATSADNNEGDTSSDFTFTVTRTGNLAKATSVEWNVAGSGGAPAAATDFVGGALPSGSLSFASGETSKIITVSVLGDLLQENDESFNVNLSNASAGTELATETAAGIIRDNDTGLLIAATSVDLIEDDAGSQNHTFTVTRTGDLSGTTTADWTITGATDVNDFSALSGTVNFAANESSQVITVQALGDTTVESTESFTVTLSNASNNADIQVDAATSSIIADDIALTVTAGAVSVLEGATGTTNILEYTVTRTGDTASTTSVDWTATGLSAADVSGSSPLSGSLAFAANELIKTISIIVLGDMENEADETLTVTLSNPGANTALITDNAFTVVTNDDGEFAITATNATLDEGDTGETDYVFTVTRAGDTNVEGTIDWRVELPGGLADANIGDFSAAQDGLTTNGGLPSGSLTFAAGITSQEIRVRVATDGEVEQNENFNVVLDNPTSNNEITTPSAAGVIQNDDTGFSIIAVTSDQLEGQSGTTTYTYTVTRAGDISNAALVDWSVAGAAGVTGADAAASAGDFTGVMSGTLNFNANEASVTLDVIVNGDTTVEEHEGFQVTIANARLTDTTAQVIVDNSADGLIRNDDQSFAVAAANSTITEGNSSTTQVSFNVTRSGDSSAEATVDYVMTGANGAVDSDIIGSLPSGTLTFAAGQSILAVSVDVNGDTLAENDEDFTLTLSNQSTGFISTANATTTVINDDINYAITAPVDQAEGESGTTTVEYTVQRTGDTSGATDILWRLLSATGLTTADFVGNQDVLGTNAGLPSGTLSFANNQISKTISLAVAGDTTLEADETLTIELYTPTAGTIQSGDETDSMLLLSDDDQFDISADIANLDEANSDHDVTFSVTRTGSLDGARTLNWAASGLSADDFVGGSVPSGTVSFADGVNSATITVSISGDSTVEADETLTVTLSGAPNNSIIGSNSATTTLVNDDASLAITPLLADKNEGNTTLASGEIPQDNTSVFTVGADGDYQGEIGDDGLDWRDKDWFRVNLTEGHSYLIRSEGSGSGGNTLLPPRIDGIYAEDGTSLGYSADTFSGSPQYTAETTFTPDTSGIYFISAASYAGGGYEGTYTLKVADQTTPGADVSVPAVTLVPFTFTVTRSGDTDQVSTVDWRVGGGTDPLLASEFDAGGDILGDNGGLPSGSLTFTAGEVSKVVTINVVSDNLLEADETLRVTLSNSSAGTSITTESADGVVRNDDAELNITAGTASLIEGDAGHSTGVAYTYTVTRTGNTDQVTTVDWDVAHGTTDQSDFSNGSNANINPSNTLTFNSGETSKTITVYAHGDTGAGSVEDDETFSVQLSNSNEGSSIGSTSSFDSTIVNDDTMLTLSVDDYSKAEAVAGGSTTYTYTVTRTGDISGATSYTWLANNTNAETGQPGYVYDLSDGNTFEYPAGTDDFSGNVYPSGSGSFSANQVTDTFTVTISGDDVAEDDQWFHTKITATSGYDEINVVYDNPDQADGAQLFRTYYSSNYYYDNTAVSSSSNGVSSNTNYIYSSIERDEGLFSVLDKEVTAEGNHALLSSHLEGDTSADGGSDDLVAHIFAVQRTVATAGDAWVTWRAVNYSNASADDFADGSDARTLGGGVLASGTVNFVDGQEWGYITIYTKPDDLGEYDEIFHVYLDGVSGGSSINTSDDQVGSPYNFGYITNDDTRFDASVNDVTEGGVLTFTITRDGDARGTDTVDWSLVFPSDETTNEDTSDETSWYKLDPSDVNDPVPSNGTATYVSGTLTWGGTLTFVDGETTQTITVQTIDDNLPETWKENLPIILSNATNVDVSEVNHDLETASTGYTDTAQVYDNEPDPILTLSVDSTSVFEGTAANSLYNDQNTGNTVTFTITRTDQQGDALDYSSTVGWYLSGSNLNRSDYGDIKDYGTVNRAYEYNSGSTYGNVYFADNETEKQITITYNGDDFVENDETLTFRLMEADQAESWLYDVYGGVAEQNGYGPANLDTSTESNYIQQQVTIKNDDVRLWIDGWDTNGSDTGGYNTNLNVDAYEGNPLAFSVVRAGRMDNDVEVGYEIITNGSAVNGDFDTLTGTFTLAAQANAYSNSFTYNISLADILGDDSSVEVNETFTLRLTTPGDTAGSSVRFQSYATNTSAWNNAYSGKSTTLDLAGTLYDDDTTYTLTPASTSLVETDDGSNQTYSFTVDRASTGYSRAATLKWKVEAVGGDPANGDDFSTDDSLGTNSGLPSGSVSFADGELTQQFSVVVAGDIIAENNEAFRVVLFEDTLTTPNPDITNSHSIASADLTILADDTGISINDAVINEGDSGTTNLTFTVTRSGDLSGTSTMDYELLHGTTDAADVTGSTSGSLVFTAGQSSKTVTIQVVGDVTVEDAENFNLQLSNFAGVDDAIDFVGEGTITNDDTVFSIAQLAASSEEDGVGQTFSISRTKATVQDQTVNWAVSTDTANTADFGGSFPSGSVTFTGNELSKTITINPSSDITAETDETYNVSITLGAGTAGDNIATDAVVGTILNDDATLNILTDQATGLEGHSGTTDFTFSVNRSGSSSGTASVDWALSGALAADFATGQDILTTNGGLPSGTLNFADGITSQIITVQVVADAVVEADESFTITLSNATDAHINTATANATITNDDSTLAITATDASVAEGNNGTTAFTFTVTRTGYNGDAATGDYAVTGSGANPADGADFGGTLPSGTWTIPAGQNSETFTVLVSGDLTAELIEGFDVTLSNPSAGATITTATASGSILADDVVFSVAAPVTQSEGDTGATTNFAFDVTRTGDVTGTQTLTWTVAGFGANAASTDDFDALTGTVTFNPSDTTQTILVPVTGDDRGEANEDFRLTLTSSDGVVFTNDSADALITDDEASLRIETLDSSKAEGQDGDSTVYTFRVTRTGNESLATDVDWAVAGLGDLDAADFGGTLPSGSLHFNANDNEEIISITVSGDDSIEADEDFTVSLSNASAGADIVVADATGEITSDDTLWNLEVISAPTEEGDAAASFTFRISRSGGLSAATVGWGVTGSGVNAAEAADFAGSLLPNGSLSFGDGETSQDITVTLNGDNLLELDETFTIGLNAPAGTGQHSFTTQSIEQTIINDDDQMAIVSLSSDAAEGTGSQGVYSFTVTRNGSVDGTSSVDWQIVHGTTNAGDFAAISGTVSFIDGQGSATIFVNTIGDRVLENDETFSVELTNPGQGSTIDSGAANAAGVIRNDDVDVALSLATSTVTEGDGNEITFTLTRSGDTSVSTSVNWTAVAGTAGLADFVTGQDVLTSNGGLPSGNVLFAVGETSKTITLAIENDGQYEGNESFQLHLDAVSAHADITSNDLTGTIQDDDDQLAVVAIDNSKIEGDSGTVVYTFQVNRTGTDLGATSVEWSAAGSGSYALDSNEFVATTGSVSFADGETSQTFSVAVKGDTEGEYDETFSVTLENPATGSTVIGSPATATVLNDDAVLSISANQASLSETNEGQEQQFSFTVTRSGDTSIASSALWSVVNSGATPATALDFGGLLPTGAVGFGVGDTTATITVTVIGDTVGEDDETFSVVLSDPQNATLLEGSAETTIANDDTGLRITATDADKYEGQPGETTLYTLQVERLGLSTGVASVDWQVGGKGSYPANASDFVGEVFPSGSLIFADGETVKTITLNVAGDSTIGFDQEFEVVLSNNVGADLINTSADGVIRNDDNHVSVAAQNASQVEGDSGTLNYSFAVTRTGELDLVADIGWRVVGSGGSQADADDFGGTLPNGTVNFGIGQDTVIVTVEVSGDTATELDEQFDVELLNPGAGVSINPIADSASSIIETDDVGVVLIAVDNDRAEGETGEQAAFSFRVLRSGPIDSAITVQYVISGAVDANDFVAPLTGTFVMAAGVSSQLLTLNAQGDDTVETDEAFIVTLSSAEANVDSSPVSGVIRDDDNGISIAARRAVVTEGTGVGTTEVFFDVTRTTSDAPTIVNWAVTGSGLAAIVATDIDGNTLPTGSVSFGVGVTSVSFSILIDQDAVVEVDELLTATITSTDSNVIAIGSADVTITNDDTAGAGADEVVGSGSGDALDGFGGTDILYGLAGDDVIRGGDEADQITGGEGGDVLLGGAGADLFRYESPTEGSDVLQDFTAGSDQIGFVSAGFGGLSGPLVAASQSFATDLTTTLSQLADKPDSDLYKVAFDPGVFDFGTGIAGQLDELEAAMTSGNHTGGAFLVVSNGSESHVYFDADTAQGSDGSGLIELAEIPTLDYADIAPDDMIIAVS